MAFARSTPSCSLQCHRVQGRAARLCLAQSFSRPPLGGARGPSLLPGCCSAAPGPGSPLPLGLWSREGALFFLNLKNDRFRSVFLICLAL